MILLSAPTRSDHPLKKNETLRHFTDDARKQKTIHKYNKNWKDFDFGLDGIENGFENRFEKKKKKGGGGHEVNWKKQMKKDILRLFRGDGSWYENLDNTVSKIQQTILGQLFPFLVFGGGGASPPRGGEVMVGGDDTDEESDEVSDQEVIKPSLNKSISNISDENKYSESESELPNQNRNNLKRANTAPARLNNSNPVNKDVQEETNSEELPSESTLIYPEPSKLTSSPPIQEQVFAILKYCLESTAATTATAATPEDNDDEELLEESAQIPDEDIDPADILSIKEFETTNNETPAKNRSVRIKTPMDYYEKMNHDLQNIMMMGTEGQREVVNHVDPKSYFEENPMIESIDEEMDAKKDAERIGKPEVVVNVPETLADGYSDLSRATVFVDPEKVVKENRDVDEIFSKNTRELVDETVLSNYPRVMTEEEAEILGVMSPMKLAACAMLKYCSVPVKGFWSDTVWNGLKKGVKSLGTGISNAKSNVTNLYNNRQDRLRVAKEQKKLDTNRKQAGLAILKYCLGYEDINNNNAIPIISVTNQTPEDNEKYKEPSMAILKYCLSEPSVLDNRSIITPVVNVATVPDNNNNANPIISVTTPEDNEKYKKPSMAILKYCLPKSYWPTFSKRYWDALKNPEHKLPAYSATGTNNGDNSATGTNNNFLEELKNVQFQREQRSKAAGYSILKYCLEELGKRNFEPVPQAVETKNISDNLLIENAEEPQNEQEIPGITSNQELKKKVEPGPDIEEEKPVYEETDKYKEQSLTVLKYCLEYEDKLRRDISKGVVDKVLNTGLNNNVQENVVITQVSNSPSVITPSLNPQVPSNLTYEEAAALEKQQQEASVALLKQQNKDATAALEKQQQEAATDALLEQQNKAADVTMVAEKQAELEKEQEKQRQTAGFSMLKYCLDKIMNTKLRQPPVIPKLQLQDMISSNISNLNTPQTTERSINPLSARTSDNTSRSIYSQERARSTTPRINQYNKQLLAMIGLKYYLQLKKNSQENKEAVNKEDIIIEDIEDIEDNSLPSSSRIDS